MNKITAEKCREQFQKWWESFYDTSPREAWDDIYSPEHDYYVDEGIDTQYDAWKASRQALEIALPVLEQQQKQKLSVREGLAQLSAHIDSIGGYNFEALEAYRREEFGQQEKGDEGWIEWGGGENPAEGNLVQVEFRDGFIDDAQHSGNYRWYHEPNSCDIIAYRVVRQERERGEEE